MYFANEYMKRLLHYLIILVQLKSKFKGWDKVCAVKYAQFFSVNFILVLKIRSQIYKNKMLGSEKWISNL